MSCLCFCTPLVLTYPPQLRCVRLWPADQDPLRIHLLTLRGDTLSFVALNLYAN